MQDGASSQLYYDAVKNSRAYALLEGDILSGSVSHSYLLVSQDNSALNLLANLFIVRFLAKEQYESWIERIAHNNLPDVIRLPRGEKVLTADAEFLVETAYLTPMELDKKFYIIDKSETMNESAQNKILKMLEEPPSRSVNILLCTNEHALLPTVISRCKRVALEQLGKAQLRELAAAWSQNPLLCELIAETGFLGLEYIERVRASEEYEQLFELVLSLLMNMRRSADVAKYSFSVGKYKDKLDILLLYLECILRDCMLLGVGKAALTGFPSKAESIGKIAEDYRPEVVAQIMPLLGRTRQRIAGYGNAVSIIDEMLLMLLEEKSKWQRL